MSIHRPSSLSLFDPEILRQASWDAVKKLDPRELLRNPVIFVTAIVSLIASFFTFNYWIVGSQDLGIYLQITLWLWFTVLFANLAEAMAEGRGKAQANFLRSSRTLTLAKKIQDIDTSSYKEIPAGELRTGDLVVCESGDIIPGDGDCVVGIATVDESAITGESAPVIRESGGDRSAVTGGTKVVSDRIVVKITVNPGESFLDRMISLIEGARRQKTPNEIALNLLLLGMTGIFFLVVITLPIFASWSQTNISGVFLIALFVTLIPTTIGGLLSAIGISGMDRLIRFNIIAKSGRAVEAAGDVDVLLLDKTGTITIGARQAVEFLPLSGINERDLAYDAFLASFADETPEGKSIVALARARFNFVNPEPKQGEFIGFSAHTRMSGINIGEMLIRKGAADSIIAHLEKNYGLKTVSSELKSNVEKIAKSGGTPLVVCKDSRILGVIYLKDIIKEGIRERFATLRQMGIRTVMITGDNSLTAAAIAAEAGVDDCLAEATPERKLELIRQEQAQGKLVAMCGDGSNDAPALAQADVGVAMNTGTQAAREAANMVDLENDPTKLIEIVMIGKQLLISRGALTTFSIANDVAKYFAIIPALFMATYPQMQRLNLMGLSSPQSAILSAIIFNALIIIALIPLALKGVKYQPKSAESLLKRNLLLYGLGGIIAPFVGIKLIDMLITWLNLA